MSLIIVYAVDCGTCGGEATSRNLDRLTQGGDPEYDPDGGVAAEPCPPPTPTTRRTP